MSDGPFGGNEIITNNDEGCVQELRMEAVRLCIPREEAERDIL